MRKPCFFRHRWSAWRSEFQEMPDGWDGTYEIRTRECTRGRCDMIEEVSRCVSLSPEVVSGLTP